MSRNTQQRDTQRHDIAKKDVVLQIPGMDRVKVRRDIEYRATEAGVLTMDVYYPPDHESGAQIPAVVFVSGCSDLGVQKMLGCKLKEMQSYVSWGQLTAVSGLAAITYETTEPTADVQALLQYVRENAGSLDIDKNSIGVWACSGNVPLALSVLMQKDRDYLRFAVLCYGAMLDLDGSTSVAELSKTFGFVNPCVGKSVDDLPKDVPVFIVRAGQDEMPHLNEAVDRFVEKALICNLPLTFVNLPDAPHAFDLMQDSETSRETIRQILAFMRSHLLV